MRFYQFADLIKFYLQAKSPKNIDDKKLAEITSDIQKKEDKVRFGEIEKIRKSLKKNQQIITIQDLGAGSQYSKNKDRSIASIANSALSPAWQCRILSNIVDKFGHKNIVELGTSLGISALYLGLNKIDKYIYTLEGSKAIAKVAQDNFDKISFKNNELILGNFDNTLPKILEKLDRIDFAFIDGNHTKDATIRYYKLTKPKCHNNSVIVFDDIYWSKAMQEAWIEIITKKEITASLDFYSFGIVFFDKSLAGNYKIIPKLI